MKRVTSISLISVFCFIHAATGQWTERDSIWLQQVLSGEEELRLSPETEETIRAGTFLNSGMPQTPLLAAPPVLPISKDFSDVILSDTIRDPLDILSLPPAVFKWYVQQIDSVPEINRNAYTPLHPLVPKEWVDIPGAPVQLKTGAGNLFLPEVRDGQSRGSLNLNTRTTFSAEELLRTIFWKSERAKRRNRKHATAWKNYNQY
ncbi:MAG: hypothetical protein LUG98_13175 [Tannerellaceae bacterium]|nr:hypothetical protein [Tannerellaceae bacterium]